MKIALVTFEFDSVRPGGVGNAVIKIVDYLTRNKLFEVEIISFSNKSSDINSKSILNFRTYKNKLFKMGEFYGDIPVIRIGSVGSELEFLRYRKRKELLSFFNKYDLIFVKTGVLQFANVIPKLKKPLLVQCATRLVWERKSQYNYMSFLKRNILKLQLPLLSLQEYKVIHAKTTFLCENTNMFNWISNRSENSVTKWYPGVNKKSLISENTKRKIVKLNFVSVGRFNEPRKGWNRLLLAYKLACDLYSSLPELILIGWGTFPEEERKLIEKLQTQYPLRIVANASNEERDFLLSSSSIFLQASHEEGLGLAALEALSFGLPLICSKTDGSQEYVIDGKNGRIIEQSKNFVQDFAMAIVESQKWNREKYSENSLRLFNDRFSDEVAYKDIISIIEHEIRQK